MPGGASRRQPDREWGGVSMKDPSKRRVLLAARDLTRVFSSGRSSLTAVDGVSFDLLEGEVVSLVGESGSGKTTVARMLLGLLAPTAGSVRFAGQEVSLLTGRERKRYWRQVQAVFQDPYASFNQFYRVERLLSNSLRLLPERLAPAEARTRMEEALRHVGLDPQAVLPRLPHQLSGGQRQRVMIARALMLKPRLLIADEPTSMIDASSRVSILNVLLDLRRRLGMTILFITHDIGLAYYTSDRLLVMRRGRLVEEGTVEEVVNNPAHPYTRQLLADVPRLRLA